MQQSVGLGVAGDRHGADYPLGRRFEDLDAHAAGERVRARQVVGLYDPLLAVVSHRYLRKFGTAVVRAGRSLGARGGRAFSGSPSRARSGRGPGPAAGSGSPGLPAGVRPADYTACVVTKPTQAPGPGGPRPGHRDRLLLLDGHSLAYPAFHALPPENFSTTTGQPTNAVYGFTAMLINVVRDEQPTHIAVAFDRSERTFRHEQYVDYKANRKETPADFRTQLSLIFEVLDALGIRRLSVAGFEADDVIATLATEAAAEDMSVVIVTGDRDAFQLITDEVTVLKTGRGVSETTRFTPDVLQQTYGLTPAQYPDYAALRGDASDNLPGIPGVGEKTAAKWVTEFGSLAQLVDRVDEVEGLALAAPDGANAYVDPTALTEDDERALAGWLADPAQPKALHDAKGPMHALAARGLELAGLTSDTALAAYLALPGQRSFDLADLAVRYVGRELTGGETTVGQLTLDTGGEAEWANALAQRARATAELADALDADLERRGAARLLADVELPLVGVLAEMEPARIAPAGDHLADMAATLGGEAKEAEQAAFAVTGHEFNLGSPKH